MKYSITTARGFSGPRRQRLDGKINVAPAFPQVVELTDEELAVVAADPILVVTPIEEEPTEPVQTKAQLIEIAASLGVEVPKKVTVAQLKELIAAAEEPDDAPEEPTEPGEPDETHLVDEPEDTREL